MSSLWLLAIPHTGICNRKAAMPSVLRKMPDGTLALGYAIFSTRTIPGRWMLGDKPLDERPGVVIAWGDDAEHIFNNVATRRGRQERPDMRSFNCRAVEHNNESAGPLSWVTVEAHNAKGAAVSYCRLARVWEDLNWSNGDNAIVEVEEHGGENGVHRMAICAYEILDFSATPEGQT